MLLAVGGPVRASAATQGAQLIRLVNADRASHGRRSLVEVAYLDHIAQAHTDVMARAGDIFHTSTAGLYRVCCWIGIGENVGMGPASDGVAGLERAFMASREHKRNILVRQFTQIGVGVATRGDAIYVTELFRWPSAPVRYRPRARARPQGQPVTVALLVRMLAMEPVSSPQPRSGR